MADPPFALQSVKRKGAHRPPWPDLPALAPCAVWYEPELREESVSAIVWSPPAAFSPLETARRYAFACNGNVPLVVRSGPLVRRVARDDPALLKDNLDNLVLVRGREDVLEFLLAGAAQDSLRALARVEDVERVDDFDEGDGAVCGTERASGGQELVAD